MVTAGPRSSHRTRQGREGVWEKNDFALFGFNYSRLVAALPALVSNLCCTRMLIYLLRRYGMTLRYGKEKMIIDVMNAFISQLSYTRFYF